MENRSCSEAVEYLRLHDNYTILTHRRPDGDTIGCAGALCAGLRQIGKQAFVLDNPDFTPRYLPYVSSMLTEAATGTIISVDIASKNMLPENYAGEVDFAIDHHGSNTFFAAESHVDSSAAACGEIICRILCEIGVEITPAIADALYVAVSTDTGCFRYSNTTPNTLRCAALLKEKGADTATLNRELFEVKTRARLNLEAHLTGTLRLFANGKIGICFLTMADMDRLGATTDDTDSIAGFARDLEGVEIGALLRELAPGKCKISLRTNDRLWNASGICRRLDGGGHPAAAGATVEGTLEDTLQALLRSITEETGLTI